MAVLAVLFVVSAPTFVLILFGTLPTAVAFIVDPSPQRNLSLSVGALNLAGLCPAILDVWTAAESGLAVHAVLTDLTSFVLMYGGAGLGWMLYGLTPPTIRFARQTEIKTEIARMKDRQERLVETWGPEVGGRTSPPVDDAGVRDGT